MLEDLHFYLERLVTMSNLELAGVVSILCPLILWLMPKVMEWCGEDVWRAPKGTTLHIGVAFDLMIWTAALTGYFNQRNDSLPTIGSLIGGILLALVWHGWHSSLMERREKQSKLADRLTI